MALAQMDFLSPVFRMELLGTVLGMEVLAFVPFHVHCVWHDAVSINYIINVCR